MTNIAKAHVSFSHVVKDLNDEVRQFQIFTDPNTFVGICSDRPEGGGRYVTKVRVQAFQVHVRESGDTVAVLIRKFGPEVDVLVLRIFDEDRITGKMIERIKDFGVMQFGLCPKVIFER